MYSVHKRTKEGPVCQRIQDALRQQAFGDHLRSYQRNGQIPAGGYRPERGKRYPKVIVLPGPVEPQFYLTRSFFLIGTP